MCLSENELFAVRERKPTRATVLLNLNNSPRLDSPLRSAMNARPVLPINLERPFSGVQRCMSRIAPRLRKNSHSKFLGKWPRRLERSHQLSPLAYPRLHGDVRKPRILNAAKKTSQQPHDRNHQEWKAVLGHENSSRVQNGVQSDELRLELFTDNGWSWWLTQHFFQRQLSASVIKEIGTLKLDPTTYGGFYKKGSHIGPDPRSHRMIAAKASRKLAELEGPQAPEHRVPDPVCALPSPWAAHHRGLSGAEGVLSLPCPRALQLSLSPPHVGLQPMWRVGT